MKKIFLLLSIILFCTNVLADKMTKDGFLSNKNESKLLGQSRYRQKIAQAIFSALVNFKDKYENPLIGDN